MPLAGIWAACQSQWSGSQNSELKVRTALLGTRDMVTSAGNIPNEEVRDRLGAADLFLFASTSETE